jgi:hypothetical protein
VRRKNVSDTSADDDIVLCIAGILSLGLSSTCMAHIISRHSVHEMKNICGILKAALCRGFRFHFCLSFYTGSLWYNQLVSVNYSDAGGLSSSIFRHLAKCCRAVACLLFANWTWRLLQTPPPFRVVFCDSFRICVTITAVSGKIGVC